MEARLRAYAALLSTWTRRINLVSRADHDHIWDRHVLDSLRLVPLVPPGATHLIDLGSGAGLPGLVLAIAIGIPTHLVESDRRKATFLQEAARLTAAPATIHACRIEDARLPPAPVVTARALAPLFALLALATPHLAPNGLMLFPKGNRGMAELVDARREWSLDATVHGPASSPILAIRNPASIDEPVHA